MPFVYTFLFLVSMVFYMFASDQTILVLDTLFYVSPVVVVQFLILSESLRLCKWHKTACALPLIPQVMVVLDRTFVIFSERVVECFILTIALMAALLLISAYKVFFGNGCEKRTP